MFTVLEIYLEIEQQRLPCLSAISFIVVKQVFVFNGVCYAEHIVLIVSSLKYVKSKMFFLCFYPAPIEVWVLGYGLTKSVHSSACPHSRFPRISRKPMRGLL